MMSSLGSHGLTPLPSGAERLGISTDLNTVSAGQTTGSNTRNPEEDKLHRLQEVVKLLRSAVAGRGICREGVERLAQLAGFTHIWQGNTLAIAGTCVDLEITFDGIEKDDAKDVVLKIFTPEFEQHKRDASEVLKSNLDRAFHAETQEPWHSLEDFATNLEHLGRMDHLSQGFNCFEAIDGLYSTFKRIWEEEKKRMNQRRSLDCLCRGATGRPVLNRKKRLGLSLEYWAERRYLAGSKLGDAGRDAPRLGHPELGSERIEDAAGLWTAAINCEAGYPSLRVSKEWVAETIFVRGKIEDETRRERASATIAWDEPAPTLVRSKDNTNDPNPIDLDEAEIKIPKPPQVRFMVNLEPSVLVPLSIASSVLNKQGLSVTLDDSKFTTFNQALQFLGSQASSFKDTESKALSQRWPRSLCTLEGGEKEIDHYHSYTLYSTSQIWCYPVQSATFDHPKHLVDLLPVLRQYALLWTLLRSIVPTMATKGTEAVGQVNNTAVFAKPEDGESPFKRSTIKKKNNRDPRRAKVNRLLRDRNSDASFKEAVTSSTPMGIDPKLPLPVDISLSLTSPSPSRPKLDLIWPLQSSLTTAISMDKARFASVSIEVGHNGEISVPSVTGIPMADSDKGRRRIAQAVGLCEDLGLVVEWIMEKLGG
jgi:Mediator of RNA polymerase II transcription subunit 1